MKVFKPKSFHYGKSSYDAGSRRQSAHSSPAYTGTGTPGPQASQVSLWNPSVAANWSIVLTPAFGAWLHASNWRAIGDHGKAAKSMFYLLVTITVLSSGHNYSTSRLLDHPPWAARRPGLY